MPVNVGAAHIEVDLDRQVLFLVDDNAVVQRILPVSTGSGEEFKAQGYWRTATTPSGHLEILKKIKGWKKSPLGELYYPSYIVGGIAIHGHPQIPAKPASHGCIRIPMFAAKEFFSLAPVGMDVFVLFKPEAAAVLPE
jgi:lipoprotein-anchoring transpeptidase ErfK/SrfK